MLCLSVLRATEQQRDLLSYNMYFPLGHVETYWNYSMTQCLMIRLGKVFARKPEDWFSGSLLSSFAVSRLSQERKAPEKPWKILSGHHGLPSPTTHQPKTTNSERFFPP